MSSEAIIPITVKLLGQSRPFLLQVREDGRVSDLKRQIHYAQGIPVCRQRLLHGNRELSDDQPLSKYNLLKQTLVHLILLRDEDSSSIVAASSSSSSTTASSSETKEKWTRPGYQPLPKLSDDFQDIPLPVSGDLESAEVYFGARHMNTRHKEMIARERSILMSFNVVPFVLAASTAKQKASLWKLLSQAGCSYLVDMK